MVNDTINDFIYACRLRRQRRWPRSRLRFPWNRAVGGGARTSVRARPFGRPRFFRPQTKRAGVSNAPGRHAADRPRAAGSACAGRIVTPRPACRPGRHHPAAVIGVRPPTVAAAVIGVRPADDRQPTPHTRPPGNSCRVTRPPRTDERAWVDVREQWKRPVTRPNVSGSHARPSLPPPPPPFKKMFVVQNPELARHRRNCESTSGVARILQSFTQSANHAVSFFYSFWSVRAFYPMVLLRIETTNVVFLYRVELLQLMNNKLKYNRSVDPLTCI